LKRQADLSARRVIPESIGRSGGARHEIAAALAGARVHLGYGRDEQDMLAHGRHALIHEVAVPADSVHSNRARDATPASAADLAQLADDNGRFAFDLYRRLVGEGNLFFLG